MVQVVMQKVIGERVAYAVDALTALEGAEFAENFVHNEIFYHIAAYMQTKTGEPHGSPVCRCGHPQNAGMIAPLYFSLMKFLTASEWSAFMSA